MNINDNYPFKNEKSRSTSKNAMVAWINKKDSIEFISKKIMF